MTLTARTTRANLRELHLEKSIDVLNIGEPANSRPVTVKADDLRSTLLVSNDFFAVTSGKLLEKLTSKRQLTTACLVS